MSKECFNSKENAEIFKTFYENLSTVPNPTNNGMDSIKKYYNGLGVRNENFKFQPASETMIHLILESINPDKAVVVHMTEKFLNDGSNILKEPNLLIFP